MSIIRSCGRRIDVKNKEDVDASKPAHSDREKKFVRQQINYLYKLFFSFFFGSSSSKILNSFRTQLRVQHIRPITAENNAMMQQWEDKNNTWSHQEQKVQQAKFPARFSNNIFHSIQNAILFDDTTITQITKSILFRILMIIPVSTVYHYDINSNNHYYLYHCDLCERPQQCRSRANAANRMELRCGVQK